MKLPDTKHIIKLLIVISLLFYILFIFDARQKELDLGGLGLISSLPITYFFAAILVTISFLVTLHYDGKNKIFLYFELLLYICILYLPPILLEGTPRFNSVFMIGGEIDYIIRNSFLNPLLIRYHNWPGADIFGSIVIYFTGAKITSIFLYTPLITQIIYLPILLAIFNEILDTDKKIFMSLWLFYTMNWLNQDYFAPQNMAFLFYLLILFILIKYVLQSDKKQFGQRVCVVLLIISLVVSHILTTFTLMLNIIVIYIFSKYKQKINMNIFPLLLTVFIAWQFYGARFILPKLISKIKDALYIELTVHSTSNLITRGSLEHNLVTNIRMDYAILFVVIAFTGFFYSYIIRKHKTDISKTMLLFGLSTIPLLSIGGYGGEIIIRILLFSLIPLIFFGVQNMDNKHLSLFLMVFLVISPVFHIIGHYGNETVDYTAPGDIKGTEFLISHASPRSDIISLKDRISEFKNYEDFFHYFEYNDVNRKIKKYRGETLQRYLMITRRSYEYHNFLAKDTRFEDLLVNISKPGNYIKIYSNNNFNLFKYNNQTSDFEYIG